MNTTHAIPAALVNKGTEIFFYKDDLYAVYNQASIPFIHWPSSLHQMVWEELQKDSEAQEIFDLNQVPKAKRIFEYAKCRFGAFNTTADFTEDGKTNTEHWNCDCGGNCLLEDLFRGQMKVANGHLTEREIDVTICIALNLTGKEIADDLNISESTLNNHKANIFRKTGFNSNVQLAVWAVAQNII